MAIVLHVRAFRDNYIWIIRSDSGDQVAIVDPGDATPVLDFLAREALVPVAILITHHHNDHAGGITALTRVHPMPVYGPANEAVVGVTHPRRDGDKLHLRELSLTLDVWEIPGHTLGHIAYTGDEMVFCGDTLFSAGCGRLFEGTPAQLHGSLSRLATLPGPTRVYCGHEYTLANLGFALTVEPDNADAAAYRAEAERQQQDGQPTLPSTIAREQRINPFLRVAEPSVRRAVETQANRALTDDISVFAALRRWKDDFRG